MEVPISVYRHCYYNDEVGYWIVRLEYSPAEGLLVESNEESFII